MSDAIDFNFFHPGSGKNRPTVTDEQRAALSPEKRARFEAVEKAIGELAEVTAQEKQAVTDRKVAAAMLDKAKAHLDTVQPPVTELQMQRRMALPEAERMRLSRIPVSQEIKAAIFAAAEAEDVFQGLMVTCRNLQEQILHLKAALARRVGEFQAEFVPQTPGELIKSHLKAEQQRRRDGTDTRPSEQSPPASRLDAFMQGSRGPLGVRSARQLSRNPDGPRAGPVYPASMRGQRVAPPKVPTWQTKPRGAA